MKPAFTVCGKQVLKDGRDFAQAFNTDGAEVILAALQSYHAKKEQTDGRTDEN